MLAPQGGGRGAVEGLVWVPRARKAKGFAPQALRSIGTPWGNEARCDTPLFASGRHGAHGAPRHDRGCRDMPWHVIAHHGMAWHSPPLRALANHGAPLQTTTRATPHQHALARRGALWQAKALHDTLCDQDTQ